MSILEEFLDFPIWGEFRVWHILFALGAMAFIILIFLCCCIRFRIPRTKEEIEADYIRKKITGKFRKQLFLIKNSEMDEMDLLKALDRVKVTLAPPDDCVQTIKETDKSTGVVFDKKS